LWPCWDAPAPAPPPKWAAPAELARPRQLHARVRSRCTR
jgi:hypothetical protein